MGSETKYNNCHSFTNQTQQLLGMQKPNTTIVAHSESKYNNCHAYRN